MSVIALLKKYQVQPKKRLGQNFLISPPTLQKIVQSCQLSPDDVTLEVGSGLGVMTSLLAEKCQHIIAVEKDISLFTISKQEFGHISNITWINDDILQINFQQILSTDHSTQKQLQIVGNIPYEITSPLLFHLLDQRKHLINATLLMQKEVAERLIAIPCTKEYGILSVILQAYANVEKIFDVAPSNFSPSPKVVSSLIRIHFHASSSSIKNELLFRKLVRTAFGKRRKTLRNALKGTFDTQHLEQSFDLDLNRRAETLSVEEYISLANHLEVL
ncbi:MAG: ribosomal RNA small subunit methyltransferase A [Deltaproteobacteria bacterium RIFCSPLOWO2_02_FULL_44_10]|nr:MAG: ribosomal RNA small subunit methyltransferase A [Deltaproteobacteria bacterium RIFCSPHIGHO2_02_FULL_44_16]OGQ45343.1 MAG: ribosomal RNA small subunit methyltransferase A [Deltaproteobacteria bacterium RIFCSPLOWO2_02_FULL_44_10]